MSISAQLHLRKPDASRVEGLFHGIVQGRVDLLLICYWIHITWWSTIPVVLAPRDLLTNRIRKSQILCVLPRRLLWLEVAYCCFLSSLGFKWSTQWSTPPNCPLLFRRARKTCNILKKPFWKWQTSWTSLWRTTCDLITTVVHGSLVGTDGFAHSCMSMI